MEIIIFLIIYFAINLCLRLLLKNISLAKYLYAAVDFFLLIALFGSAIPFMLLIILTMMVLSYFQSSLFGAFLVGISVLFGLVQMGDQLTFIDTAGLSFLLFRILADWTWFRKNCSSLTELFALLNPSLLIMGPIQSPELDRAYPGSQVDWDSLLSASYRLMGGVLLVFISFAFFSVSPALFGVGLSVVTFESWLFAWTLGLLFLTGLYLNFFGFCMVVESGRAMLGLDTIKNFNDPLASKSFTEFWRRWHVTLGRVVSQAFYSQLAVVFSRRIGIKKGALLATLLSFFVIGLWHGPKIEFVLFGLIHGVMVASEVVFRNSISQLVFWIVCPLTFYLFALGVS